MILLHTSDWHLGHTWHGQTRREEFSQFFAWIIETIIARNVNVLLIAGDIFDTANPSPEIQSDYYGFLKKLSDINSSCFEIPEAEHASAASRSGCSRAKPTSHTGSGIKCLSKIVIIAGNHDSPYLLDAPRELLSSFSVRVVGSPDFFERELVEVCGESGEIEMLIAAVPFLREGDIRKFDIGESIECREQKILNNFKKHYADICQLAEQKRDNKPIPLVVTGHLFVDGGKTSEGVREIHVGTLGQVGLDLFPDGVDYFAFGHLHVPQCVGKNEAYRYSGSPLPISFDEAGQTKSVVLAEFSGREPKIEILPVPKFVNVVRVEGGISEIEDGIRNLPKDIKSFVEVSYNGSEFVTELLGKVEEIVSAQEHSDLINVVRVRNCNLNQLQLTPDETNTPLERIEPIDIFRNLLKNNNVEDSNMNDLLRLYGEVEQEVRLDRK
ncbi:MAG: exonuclease subunit SbcD [Planctomycetaceae bacterium]|jgi:exonuclease SbcD|nr:exonuclease subunit SbcD [Planctomycetaceae bacterium]